MTALVVIPTTGTQFLTTAINSVLGQTYPKTECLIVIDGPEFLQKTLEITKHFPTVKIMLLPWNTGANGFYGHRIYAASSFITNHDYWLALDQDNYLKPTHVEDQIINCENNQLDWSYSLRSIYDKNGNYLLDDNCESLGKWPIFINDQSHLVDTSSYCIKREVITKIGGAWYGGWGADRQFYAAISHYFPKFSTTRKHSLCYRLDGNPNSVNADFFINGNAEMIKRYGSKFPWH